MDCCVFFFQAEDGIRDLVRSRGLGDVYKRQGDSFYRDRWSHDKVVRSTHGVNCTGSCSWKVYVKLSLIHI